MIKFLDENGLSRLWNKAKGYVDKKIQEMPSGIDISDTTATADDVLTGKNFYNAAGNKVSGTLFTKYATGKYTATSDTKLADILFECGFKPKLFYMRNNSVPYANSTSAPYKMTLAMTMAVGNADKFGCSFILKGTTANPARGGTSINGNGFKVTETGLQGFGSSVCCAKGVEYEWEAYA